MTFCSHSERNNFDVNTNGWNQMSFLMKFLLLFFRHATYYIQCPAVTSWLPKISVEDFFWKIVLQSLVGVNKKSSLSHKKKCMGKLFRFHLDSSTYKNTNNYGFILQNLIWLCWVELTKLFLLLSYKFINTEAKIWLKRCAV